MPRPSARRLCHPCRVLVAAQGAVAPWSSEWALEIARSGKVVWEYRVQKPLEPRTGLAEHRSLALQRLPTAK